MNSLEMTQVELNKKLSELQNEYNSMKELYEKKVSDLTSGREK